MADMSTIGGRIRHYRDITEMSQEAAAQAAGVSVTAWRQWEYGKTEPKARNIAPIARALGITPLELLDWENQE